MASLNLGSFTLNPSYTGSEATSDLFGTNFLFDRDGTSVPQEIDPNYVQFVKEANVSTVRYPGGTLAEERIDLANPDSLNAGNSEGKPPSGEVTVPLSSFLGFCQSVDASATLVLPTYRFLSDKTDSTGHRTIDPQEESNLRSYIRFALSQADTLGTKIAGFEIGNEWHVDNTELFGFRMTPVEYGRVANYMTKIVQQEIDAFFGDDLPKTDEPAIVVQVGPGGNKEWYTPSGQRVPDGYNGPMITATELILKQFVDIEARNAVDGIVTHRYLHGDDDSISGWAYSPFETWIKLASTIPGFNAVDKFVTEWNVSSRNTDQQGLAHFDTVVELVREMMLSGVSHANVWAVQQNNDTRLIENSGKDSREYGGLSIGGVAFDICAAQLPGLKVLASPEAISDIAINAFGSSERVVTFLTNRSDSPKTESIDLSKIAKGGHHATIYHVSQDSDGKPVVHVETFQITKESLEKVLKFGADESVVIVVARGDSGSWVEGYELGDSLAGSSFSDTLLGGGGRDTLRGHDGDDVVLGECGDDTLNGMDGNDTLSGGFGDDQVRGGSGDDIIILSPGSDTISGGLGTDVLSFELTEAPMLIDFSDDHNLAAILNGTVIKSIEGFAGTAFCDTLIGGSTNDLFFGGGASDSISGLDGDDTIYGASDADVVTGGTGCDSLFGGGGNDLMWGGADGDVICGQNGADTLAGEEGNDSVHGGDGSDLLYGGDGSDSIFGKHASDIIYCDDGDDVGYGGHSEDWISGGGGCDSIFGGADSDVIFGGLGDDRLAGGIGNDEVQGGEGSDILEGGEGSDALSGGTGDDMLFGGSGADVLIGGDGSDRVIGSLGDDTVDGGTGCDLLFGGKGSDLLLGEIDNDALYGGGGNDLLEGGAGDDSLVGGFGDDTLIGGSGDDWLSGGVGADSFVFDYGFGSSSVADFENDVDTLYLGQSFFDTDMSVKDLVNTFGTFSNGSVVFDFGNAGCLTVLGVSSLQDLYDDIVLIV